MTRNRSELLDELNDQIQLLENACRAFDQGSLVEYKNIATRIRVLLHDTPASKSLLGQLDVKERLVFVNDAIKFHPPGQDGIYSTNFGVCNYVSNNQRSYYKAKLGNPPNIRTDCLDFNSWWNETLMAGSQGEILSRRFAVLNVSNKDGGAHVDGRLNADYEQLLKREKWFEILIGPEDYEQGSPVPGTIRGIAYEVLETIKNNALLVSQG